MPLKPNSPSLTPLKVARVDHANHRSVKEAIGEEDLTPKKPCPYSPTPVEIIAKSPCPRCGGDLFEHVQRQKKA